MESTDEPEVIDEKLEGDCDESESGSSMEEELAEPDEPEEVEPCPTAD
jgi:hypothetical protein